MNIFLNCLFYIGITLGIIVGFILFVLLFLVLQGYLFYRKHGGSKRLFARIKEIQSDKNFKKFEEINPSFVLCLIAMEDGDFYKHKGINFSMFYKSMKYNLKHRKMYLGGSSLTQQLSKNLLFPFKKVLKRKIGELFAVRLLEKNYTKNEILELYMNCIEYGLDCYGITNAAMLYAKKEPKDLCFSESLQIISLLPAPRRYAPDKNMELFQKTRENSINAMKRKGLIRHVDGEKLLTSSPFEPILSDHCEKVYEELARIALGKKLSLEKPLLLDIPLLQKAFEEHFTEKELADYALQIAEKENTFYCWGGLMEPISEEYLVKKQTAYPNWYTPEKTQAILASRKAFACDCSGLIKSYLFEGTYEGFFDFNSSMFLEYATEKGDISTLPDRPGICLFMKGHVGIYLGNGQAAEATNNENYGNGVLVSSLEGRGWTHWFACPLLKRN